MSETLPALHDMSAYRGDTWAQTFRLSENDVPVDLAGSTVAAWAVKFDDVYEFVVTTNGSGEVTLALPEGGIPVGCFDYDVEVTDAVGGVTTWVRGKFTMQADVTNAPEPAPA